MDEVRDLSEREDSRPLSGPVGISRNVSVYKTAAKKESDPVKT